MKMFLSSDKITVLIYISILVLETDLDIFIIFS